MAPGDEDDFAALLAEYDEKDRARRDPLVGDKVRGRVVSIGADAAFVDLGAKSEGMLELAEVRDDTGKLTIKVGDEVEARVVEVGGRAGCVVLRRALGRGPEAKAELEQAFQHGVPVEGTVMAVNKGGVEVQIAGVRGFCPISQLDLRHVEDAAGYVGQRFTFRITRYEVDRRGANLVVSRRALLEEESRAKAAEVRARLQPGAVLPGTVTSLKDYGAFVDLGGIEGMLHVSEIGFSRVARAADVLSVGQRIEVVVLKIEKTGDDKRPEKISLSLKALERDPWLDAEARLHEGLELAGTISRVESFGAFVEVAPGVEGLLPIRELSAPGKKVAHARQLIKPGTAVEVVVTEVDRERRRVALALRSAQAESDDDAPPPAQDKTGFGTLGDLLGKKKR